MRMQREVLSPGVQHAQGTGLHTVSGVAKGAQRVPGSLEERVVVQPAVVQTQPVELVWYGEDQVVVPYWQR